jgi:hypothetical protein
LFVGFDGKCAASLWLPGAIPTVPVGFGGQVQLALALAQHCCVVIRVHFVSLVIGFFRLSVVIACKDGLVGSNRACL